MRGKSKNKEHIQKVMSEGRKRIKSLRDLSYWRENPKRFWWKTNYNKVIIAAVIILIFFYILKSIIN